MRRGGGVTLAGSGFPMPALLFIFGFRRVGFFPRKAVCKEWAYRDGEAQMRGLSASASAQAARYAFAFSMYSMPIRLSVWCFLTM